MEVEFLLSKQDAKQVIPIHTDLENRKKVLYMKNQKLKELETILEHQKISLYTNQKF